MSRQISLFDTIDSHIESFESQLYTGCPAIVDSYDPETCTINCYPAVYRLERDGLLIKEAILTDVPVIFPKSKQFAFTFPLEKGDRVWLQFGMSDMDAWLAGTKDYEAPQTMRKHNVNDAVAFAGVSQYSSSPVKQPENVNIYFGDSYISILPDGSVDIKVNDKFSVTNSTGELVDWLSQLTQLVSEITTNTIYGVSPINNKPAVEALKAEIDTMKK